MAIYFELVLFLLLVIPTSCSSLELEGSGYFFCPKQTKQGLYLCQKGVDVIMSDEFNTNCTKLGLANNVSTALKDDTPGCTFLYLILDAPGVKYPESYSRSDIVPDTWCQSADFDLNLHEQCERKLLNQEQDLLDMCKGFRITDDFDECQPEMFQIIRGDEMFSFTRIDQETKNLQSEYTSVKVKESDVKFKTVLQRSCLFFNRTGEGECGCGDFEVTNGTLAMDFCKEKESEKGFVEGFEELCSHFNLTLENCDCNKFNFSDNTTKQTVCDFLNPKPVKHLKHKPYFSHPYAAVETVASIIGIIGNVIVIAVAIRFRIGLAPCKKLIAHLAACDLYFAVFQITYAVPKFWTAEFIYGRFLCKVMRSTENLGVFLAIGVILTISIERFIGIINPFSRGISKKGLNGILVLNAFCGIMACIPLIYYSEVNDLGICEADWPNGSHDMFIYNLFVLIVYLVIPTIVIATLYSLIVSTLHGTIMLGKNSFIADPRLREKRLQDNRRTMYVLVGVVIAFVVFVFPKHVIMTFFSYQGYGWGSNASDRDMSDTTFVILVYIAHFSYPFHVSINPLVYSLIDARWRKDVRNFFNGHSWRNRSAYSATMSSTMTQRRRSSVATVLDEPGTKKRSPPTATKINLHNNNNNGISRPRQLLVTATINGKFDTSTLPTPLTSSDEFWMEDNGSKTSKFNF